MNEQNRLPGTGATDEVGKAAEAYMAAKREADKASDRLQAVEAILIEQLQKAGRDSIRIEGVTLTLKHIEARDKISAKKAKDE